MDSYETPAAKLSVASGFKKLNPHRHLVPSLICMALLLPLIFSSPESTAPLHLGLPCINSGDEPHYLVMINSLILDGDLDLSNNYEAVHEGAAQAGKYFSGKALDHHSVWFENGRRREWRDTYESNPERWDHDGHKPVPRLRLGQTAPNTEHPEYSTHPPGLAFLLAPVLFFFRHTSMVEPVAVTCSTLATILAMFFFRSLMATYNSDTQVVNLVTAVAFLGTPAWTYGRSLFTEPYLLLFAVGAYSLVLRARSPLLAGAFIGFGMLMKPPFALLAVPLWLMIFLEKKFRAAILLGLPMAASLAVIFWLNHRMFGSIWRTTQAWDGGSVSTGVMGLLFSWKHGCLLAAPALVLALLSWPSFLRSHSRDALVLAGAVGIEFVFFASYAYWPGGYCFGPRYLIPIITLPFVALASLPAVSWWRKDWARHGCVVICVLSIGINALVALPYWAFWDSHPILVLLQRGFDIHPD